MWPTGLLTRRQCSRSWDNVRPLGPADSRSLQAEVALDLEALGDPEAAEDEDFDDWGTGGLTILDGPADAFELPLALAFEHELRLEILCTFSNIEGEPGLLSSSPSRGRFRDFLHGDGVGHCPLSIGGNFVSLV